MARIWTGTKCTPAAPLLGFRSRQDLTAINLLSLTETSGASVLWQMFCPGLAAAFGALSMTSVRHATIDSLNRKEGYCPGRAKNAYAPLSVMVRPHGGEKLLSAETYTVCCKKTANSKPNTQYRALLVKGAEHWQLPGDYIQQLATIEVQL